MNTYRVLYSYAHPQTGKTLYFMKYLTVPADRPGASVEALAQVEQLFKRTFDKEAKLLAVKFAYYESYIVRDSHKLTSKQAMDTLTDWLKIEQGE